MITNRHIDNLIRLSKPVTMVDKFGVEGKVLVVARTRGPHIVYRDLSVTDKEFFGKIAVSDLFSLAE